MTDRLDRPRRLARRRVSTARGLTLLLACALCATLGACGDASSQAASADGSADAVDGSSREGSKPPLPPSVAEDGTLPRSYAGWTLGDPASSLDDSALGAPSEDSRYPGAEVRCKPLDERPRTRLCAYVHEGTIVRIEWRSETRALEVGEVAELFKPRLGEPDDMGILARPFYDTWNDGLSEGSTTWIVNRLNKGEWIRVGVEDTVRAGKLTGFM